MHPGSGAEWDYDLWGMVLLNVIIFGFFVWGGLRPRKPREWRSFGLVAGFILALFAEMYGFPLTIYILTATVWPALGGSDPFFHLNGHLLGTVLGLPLVGKILICIIGGIIAMYGIILMWNSWRQIHEVQGSLVTEGAYALVRHPQYLGLGLFILGLLIQWPTLLSILMAPLLLIRYVSLSRKEEAEMQMLFGAAYESYRLEIPAIIPRRRSGAGTGPVDTQSVSIPGSG